MHARMKAHYLVGILAIVLLLALSGCKTGEVVNPDVVEETSNETEEAGGSEDEEIDVKALLNQLSEEAGLETDDGEDEVNESEESDEEEITSSDVKEVTIVNFKGIPEDFDIAVGTTVKWTNEMDNFMQIIVIYPQKNDSNKYEQMPVNDIIELLHGESYEYTFENAGTFKWGSKTKFDKIVGIITVE